MGNTSFTQRYGQAASNQTRTNFNTCRSMALNSECDMPTVQMTNLFVRDWFGVRYQHLARVLRTTVAKQWCEHLDRLITEPLSRLLTITLLNTTQQQELNLSIKNRGFGLHNYTKTAPFSHAISWVSVGQTLSNYENKHTTLIPQSVNEAVKGSTKKETRLTPTLCCNLCGVKLGQASLPNV